MQWVAQDYAGNSRRRKCLIARFRNEEEREMFARKFITAVESDKAVEAEVSKMSIHVWPVRES